MKNTLWCCISCILPCGALDVIRIVHSNGRVEEISGTIRAFEIMKAHPKHVLKKPSSSNSDAADQLLPKIIVVPPEAELQRGEIYFLMPVPDLPVKTRRSSSIQSSSSATKKKKKSEEQIASNMNVNNNDNNSILMTSLVVSDDQYLTEILSEKLSSHRDRRRGRVAVWRPHLESICESPYDL